METTTEPNFNTELAIELAVSTAFTLTTTWLVRRAVAKYAEKAIMGQTERTVIPRIRRKK